MKHLRAHAVLVGTPTRTRVSSLAPLHTQAWSSRRSLVPQRADPAALCCSAAHPSMVRGPTKGGHTPSGPERGGSAVTPQSQARPAHSLSPSGLRSRAKELASEAHWPLSLERTTDTAGGRVEVRTHGSPAPARRVWRPNTAACKQCPKQGAGRRHATAPELGLASAPRGGEREPLMTASKRRARGDVHPSPDPCSHPARFRALWWWHAHPTPATKRPPQPPHPPVVFLTQRVVERGGDDDLRQAQLLVEAHVRVAGKELSRDGVDQVGRRRVPERIGDGRGRVAAGAVGVRRHVGPNLPAWGMGGRSKRSESG